MKRLAFALLLPATGALALDLGVLGPTYDIAEPDFLAFVAARLDAKEKSGELARLAQAAAARARAAVLDPAPVAGLTPTRTPRTFYVNPSFVLERNVFGPRGELLYPAGTRHNPLAVVALSKRLLFFDGRDPAQVRQARQLMAAAPGRVKPILVGGSYLALMRAWRAPVYYDQAGRLTRRLGITQVPALVSQAGERLRIDELEATP